MPHPIHRISRTLAKAIPPLERVLVNVAMWGGKPDEDVLTNLKSGPKMLVNLQEHMGLHVYVRGHHQPYVLQHFIEFLKPGMVMFDIGAHFGLFTLTAANIVGQTGHVHAFEPGETQLRYLNANVGHNSYEDRVSVNAVALGESPGEIGYEPGPERNLGASRVTTLAGGRIVPLITLDDYCREKGIDRLDAIKIDVEGFELSVLRGFSKTISRLVPKLIAYECDPESCQVHGFSTAEVHQFFLDHGYMIKTARGGAEVTQENMRDSRSRHDFIAHHV